MPNTHTSTTTSRQPGVYQIRVAGYLGSQWGTWFEGFTITQGDNGDTLLTGSVVDQAALYSLLRKVRDLGLVLLAVNRVESAAAPVSTDEGD